MRLILLVLLIAGMPFTTRADDNPLPPIPDGGFITLMSYNCTDTVYHQTGQCELRSDMEGFQYMLFYQNGEIKTIRQVTGEGTHDYIELWAQTGFGMT